MRRNAQKGEKCTIAPGAAQALDSKGGEAGDFFNSDERTDNNF
jgi:hypothetical protein